MKWRTVFNGNGACPREYVSADDRFVIYREVGRRPSFMLIDTSRTTERVICSGAQLKICKVVAMQTVQKEGDKNECSQSQS